MDRRQVPDYAHGALDMLRQTVAANNSEHNGLPTHEARSLLADEQELSEAEIDDILEVLYNYGEIYYVGEEVRVTEMKPPNSNDQNEVE